MTRVLPSFVLPVTKTLIAMNGSRYDRTTDYGAGLLDDILLGMKKLGIDAKRGVSADLPA